MIRKVMLRQGLNYRKHKRIILNFVTFDIKVCVSCAQKSRTMQENLFFRLQHYVSRILLKPDACFNEESKR